MLSESAFIDALRESPDEHSLRLVYADWLDDAGDSRGELVRLQCELDRTPLGQPRRNVLYHAIRDLCRDSHADWVAPLRRRNLSTAMVRLQFGLVENVTMSPTEFLTHAETGLFEEMPYLVGVRLRGKESQIAKALASPDINRLQSLKLSSKDARESGTALLRLASLPSARNLTSLNLANCHFGDLIVSWLLRSDNFPKLRRLNLQNNLLTRNIAAALSDCPSLPQLEMLALGTQWRGGFGTNEIGDWGVRAFTKSVPPLRLRWLDLSANDLSDSSAWDLATSDCLSNIECLYLGGNVFGKASQTALDARFPGRVFYARSEPECLCQST
jgi:uncharacterized protein (TIGR02996 family)